MLTRYSAILRFCLAFAALFLCLQLVAKDFWLEKSFTQWSRKETEKMLNDSPWAESVSFLEPAPVISSTTPKTARIGDTGERMEVYRIFHVRFLSAKPVRMALSRWNWIAKEGDKGEGADEASRKFIDAAFPEHIVLSLETESNTRGAGVELLKVLAVLNVDHLKPGTYLQSPDGKKNYLADYIPPSQDGLGAKLVFARTIDGAPFVTEQKGTLRFVTELTDRYKMNIQFKLEKMAFEGRTEY